MDRGETVGMNRPIVLAGAISHKSKQNPMESVDSVHFSQNINISVFELKDRQTDG